ncbi:MAG: DUF1553 domain-containing protein [Pirellulaceae bacterium]|nr:DUF1553 domain-containing protein [Pirellulaceae bacterium]
MRILVSSLATLVFAGQAALLRAEAPSSFQITPAEIRLDGSFDRVQVVVTRSSGDGKVDPYSQDLTGQAKFQIEPGNATVDPTGLVTAKQNGAGQLSVSIDGVSRTIPITVAGVEPTQALDFLKDVRPVLGKAGCAAGACHASQHGKGGFKLSVFGYDPVADYEQIAVGVRGRRINPARPDGSLLLEKATSRVAHGGGVRIEPTSLEYQVVRSWIAAGASRSPHAEIKIDRLDVFPKSRVFSSSDTQQLRVVAHYGDGAQRDVTALCLYDAIDTSVVNVTGRGLVTAYNSGQSAIMIRYDGQVATSTFVVPFAEQSAPEDWRDHNYVDQLAAKKFADLGLKPSPVCDDATFIRRAYLDAIGSLPEPEAVVGFIESTDPKKRELLVDSLLGLTGDPARDVFNDRYAAFWTLRWSDLIRNNSNSLGAQGMWAMHNWIRDSFRQNKPYDKFVQELVTAKGSIYTNGPANYFRVHGDSSALTEATSMLFLGMRLECAKCHQHPFEIISQGDYYSMAAFFSRVGSKNSEEFGLFGRETVVMVRPTGDVSHPRTGKRLPPKPIGGEEMENTLDRRIPLAQWLTSGENQYFSRAVVNRYAGFLLGTGLVEPVDDMRSTNPPSNQELIDALATDLVEHKFDLKHLMRVIMTSRLYSLSSQPTADNATDHRFYSHFNVKRLGAESLLDAIDHATGSPTKFKDLPLGTRAIELPDAEYPDYFLNTFAKPRRVSVCQCERSPDANLAQALHTINGDVITSKIAAKTGRVAKLLEAKKSHEEIVRDLYLAALCRLPTQAEIAIASEILGESKSPAEAYQDLLWALINTKQFLFVR